MPQQGMQHSQHMATGKNRIKATELAWYWITHHSHEYLSNGWLTCSLFWCSCLKFLHWILKQVHSVSEISELHLLNLFI